MTTILQSKIRLVATDVDHTITGAASNIDDNTLAAFRLLAENNIPVILASGRPFPVVRGLVEYLMPRELIAGAIGENGGVYQALCRGNSWPVVTVEKPKLLKRDGRELRDFFADYLADNGLKKPLAADDNISRKADLSISMSDAEGVEVPRKTAQRIERNIADLSEKHLAFCKKNELSYPGSDVPLRMNYSTVHMHFYHNADDMNKGMAVKKIIRKMGIAPEEVLVVGDSDNDVPLFEQFERRAAPANIRDFGDAPDDRLRDLDFFISEKPYSAGFLEIIRFFFPTPIERSRL